MTGIALIPNADGTSFDLDLSSGEMTLMETTPQNQAMILKANPGEFKEYPAIGVGLDNVLNDHDLSLIKRSIREQIEADGQRISKLELTTESLILEAEYK